MAVSQTLTFSTTIHVENDYGIHVNAHLIADALIKAPDIDHVVISHPKMEFQEIRTIHDKE